MFLNYFEMNHSAPKCLWYFQIWICGQNYLFRPVPKDKSLLNLSYLMFLQTLHLSLFTILLCFPSFQPIQVLLNRFGGGPKKPRKRGFAGPNGSERAQEGPNKAPYFWNQLSRILYFCRTHNKAHLDSNIHNFACIACMLSHFQPATQEVIATS